MSKELPGQLPLFTVDGIEEELQPQFADEQCPECGSSSVCWSDCPIAGVLEDDGGFVHPMEDRR